MYLDAAVCHVYLRGYGNFGHDQYIAMALNGVVFVNAMEGQPPNDVGIFTYIVHHSSCYATDFQLFRTSADPSESTRLVNYLQALTDGKSVSQSINQSINQSISLLASLLFNSVS